MNVGDDSSTGDGGFDEAVKFFVTTNGKLKMAGRNALDFEILGGVAGKLKNFSGEVLHDGSRVDCCRGTNTLSFGRSEFQETVNSSNWKLKTSTRATRLRCFFGRGSFASLSSFSSFSFARLSYVQ